MNVWILTRDGGFYSRELEILGVYATETLANQAREQQSTEYLNVEEWPVLGITPSAQGGERT